MKIMDGKEIEKKVGVVLSDRIKALESLLEEKESRLRVLSNDISTLKEDNRFLREVVLNLSKTKDQTK